MLAGLLSYSRQQFKTSTDTALRDTIEPCCCPAWQWAPVNLEIEYHHTVDHCDFKGIVRAVCSTCSRSFEVFSILPGILEDGVLKNINDPVSSETPACTCGSSSFFAAVYETHTGDFFEEGGLVGQCANCGVQQIFIQYD